MSYHKLLLARQTEKRSKGGRGFVCTESFTATLPGYDGPQAFKRGTTWVAADHEVLRSHKAKFESESGFARNALPAKRSQREASNVKSVKSSTRKAEPVSASFRAKSSAPWNNAEKRTVSTPKIVRGEGIYQLDAITYAFGEERKAATQLRDHAMRAIDVANFPHADLDNDVVRGHIETLLRTHDSTDDLDAPVARHLLRTGSPAYRRLFARHMRGETLTNPELRSLKATGSAGALLPFTLDPTIVPVSSGAINPLRAISKIETTTTNVWKGVTSAGIASGYGAEGSEVSADDAPTFAQPEVTTQRGDAWIPSAYEMDQDLPGLEHQIAALLARSKDEDEAAKFIHGTGTNEPLGLLAQLTNVTETAESGKLKLADVEAVEAALPEGYVGDAEWLGHRDIFRKVSRFDAEGSSQPWVKFPGVKPELFGLTANEISTMDATVAAGKQLLVVGDFDYHVIVDRIGMAVSLIPELSGADGRPTGSMGVFALWRNGTKVLSPEPFRLLKVKS